MKNELSAIWNLAKGYKTYVVAVAAVIYGVHAKDANIVIFGLGLAGLRNGLTHEVSKVLLASNPVKTAKEEAPAIAGEVVTEVITETPAEVTPTAQ